MCHVEYIIYEAADANENTKKTQLSGKKDLPENGCRTRACSVLRMGIKNRLPGQVQPIYYILWISIRSC
jgi:hypothetical protein